MGTSELRIEDSLGECQENTMDLSQWSDRFCGMGVRKFVGGRFVELTVEIRSSPRGD